MGLRKNLELRQGLGLVKGKKDGEEYPDMMIESCQVSFLNLENEL